MSISPFKKNAAYFYGLSDCIKKHHKYIVRILEFRDVLSQTTNPILLYTMTISSIPNPNFRFSQSTFYPEIAPDCEFWSRILFRREVSILSQKNIYAADVNFFIAHHKTLCDKKVNIRYYFGSRLLVRLYYAFLLHKKIRLL